MPVKYLTSLIKHPDWAGERYKHLDILERFLYGKIYDHLQYPFYQEEGSGGAYIPLRERRPSVKYNLARVVVSRSVGLLFGGKHFPILHTNDKEATDWFQKLVNDSKLQSTMVEAAFLGSLGSVATFFQFDENNKVHFENWNTKFCEPQFDEKRDIKQVRVRYPTFGYDLKAIGFDSIGKKDPDELAELWFYTKDYTDQEVIVYAPVKCEDFDPDKPLSRVEDMTRAHNYGFVPGVWMKNFPVTNAVDSECTFEQILDIYVEIDYQLSQCGRALKYNADPQLMIKEPPAPPDNQLMLAGMAAPRVRSASNALVVGPDGDAKLLEINGQAQKAVVEYVKELRDLALEVAQASRKNPDKAYGNMSGRAMEILDEDLISIVSIQRLTFGDDGLKPLAVKIARAAKKHGAVKFDVTKPSFEFNLRWGNWFDPTPNDLFTTEQALTEGLENRTISEPDARQIAANMWGIGQSKPEEIAKEWPELPTPAVVKDQIELKKSQMNGKPKGAGGDDGRDAKVAG